ncbi:rab11 family-interacting protein 1-like isoform X2 [Heterodontus francisci]|uniref:rab11 family-interacting protein 1-like isoform X2 n=1 Tax=Heterodontus francisci TaxID=7792 RepID=UPI00355BADD0
MAGSLALQSQHWSPSHVQVTVLRARGLRAKGKHDTSDAFAIIQLGKEKYCTSVLEKTLHPEWKEECTFEVMPAWVEQPGGGQGPGKELLIIIMHRSLMGLDKFLGQLSLPLATVYQEKGSRKAVWYKLCSKPGQKEKERGEIQVIIQFVRNNMTASMFDLSSKEKPRSALGKLKDKVKGKKKHDNLMTESVSAIVPSSMGQIVSDEELNEKEMPEKRSKKGFFSKPKLHRSSLTKSNSSLSSQQSVKSLESVSSSTGAVTVTSPQTTAAPTGFHTLLNKTNGNPSLPKKMTHKRALSDEVGQGSATDTKGLSPKSSPLSRSSLCINGSHIYSEEPSLGLFQESSPLSHSLQYIANKREDSPQPASTEEPEEKHWTARSNEKAETRLIPPVITVADEEGTLVSAADGQRKEEVGSVRGAKPVHVAVPIISTAEPTMNKFPDETKAGSIFPFGSDSKDSESRRSRTPSPVRKCSSLAERSKNTGWFMKDANHKPSLTFESQGVPDVSVPSPSTVDSSGTDWIALEKSIAKEEIPARPPTSTLASTMTRTSVNSFQKPLVTSDGAMWSTVFPSPGPDAEVKGQIMHSPLVPTNTMSLDDLDVAVPFIVPSQMKMESQVEAECSSIFTQAVNHKTVEMVPSIPNTASIQASNQSSIISLNISGLRANSKAKNNEPLDMIQEGTTTEHAKPLDLKTYSAQDTTLSSATEGLPQEEGDGSPPMIQNAVFSNEGHDFVPEMRIDQEPQTNCGSVALHQEITKEQKDLSNQERASALMEGDRGTEGIANKAEGWQEVGNSPLLVPAPEVTADEGDGTTHARNGDVSIVPLIQDKEDNGDVCLVSPSSSQVLFDKDDSQSCEVRQSVVKVGSKCQNVVMPCEGAGRSPENPADKNIISESLDKLNIQLTQTGPPPPKPPRLLAYTNQGLEEEVNLVEEQQREKETPFGLPAMAPQAVNLSEQQLGSRFEQKASLVVSSPAADEVNPDWTDSISAQSVAQEFMDNIRPSNDVVTKGDASCGAVELSVNERTGVEHYKTCLSALSLEGISMSIDDDGNSNKLDAFQQTPTLGLIEVHQAKQLFKLEPALLKTVTGMNSLETVSLVKERPPTVLERQNVFHKEETSLLWPDQTDQSELEFISAVEDLPHKSSPIFPECETSLGSDTEFSGKLGAEMSEELGKGSGTSTLRDSEETLTRSLEIKTQNSQPGETVGQSAGLGPFLDSELVTPRTETEQEATLAAHSPPDFCLPLTVKPDKGQVLEKANSVACNHQPTTRNVNFQSVSSEKPVTEDCSLAVSHGHSAANDSFFEEGLSFKELHVKAAPHALQATNFISEQLAQPPQSNKPLAFSTPYPVAVTNSEVTSLPSPILFPSNVPPLSATTQPAATPHHSLQSSGSKVPLLTVLLREIQPAAIPFPQQRSSPHPVKPISSTVAETTEKKSGRLGIGSTLSSGLEKLKNVTTGSISPIRSPAPGHEEQEAVKEIKPEDPVARYYHLTHDELIKIILQQEVDLQKKEEHVRDLEEYIDQVVVQVMEQKPSILQSVSRKMKNKAANK